jgi:hypothetical protein
MGLRSYAGVDYNLTLRPQSRLQHIYQPWATLCQSRPSPYARVDFTLQSGTLDLASVGPLYQSLLSESIPSMQPGFSQDAFGYLRPGQLALNNLGSQAQ